MKTVKKIIIFLVMLIIGGIIVVICYLKFILPSVGNPEDIKIALSPDKIERGRYLANSVCVCMDCHSKRDWSKFAGPLVPGTYGEGGELFDQKEGFPGTYYSRNITPYALQNWTDGELLRAVSCGVNKQGHALFPVMPYLNYGQLDRDDIYAVIAFIRTIKPIVKEIPPHDPDFPMNFILNTIPRKAMFTKIPDPNNKVAYGSYLLTAASCGECHTRQVKGSPVAGMELAGGFEFPLPTGGIVRSANITPDMETGIGNWTETDFVKRFKTYADSTYKPKEINNGDFNSMMPWTMYCNMKVEDLSAIYAYLRTVKPVTNRVVKFTGNNGK